MDLAVQAMVSCPTGSIRTRTPQRKTPEYPGERMGEGCLKVFGDSSRNHVRNRSQHMLEIMFATALRSISQSNKH